MSKKLFAFVSLLAVLTLLLAACAPAATQAPTKGVEPTKPAKVWKLAAIFPGVITDADYNTLGYIGMTAVQAELGVKSVYSESVPVPDVERVMREYVDAGYNIIWTHGSQFVTQTTTLAKSFPNVVFIAEGDAPVDSPPTNLWVIDRNFHVGYYALGVLATKVTKTGKIAYVGGLTLPFSYAEVHAIEQAIADTGAKVTFKRVWAGDFNDPTKARQVTDAMIAEGVDVIMGSFNLGMFGVFEGVKAAKDKVLVTAKYIDKSSYAPNNVVTSLLYDFAGPMKEIVGSILKGTMGGYYPLGFKTGVALQMPLKNVDAAVNADIQKVIDDLKSGKITVKKDFTAPQ